MIYLSMTHSPIKNLELIEKGIYDTKDSKACKEKVLAKYDKVIKPCKVALIASIALGILLSSTSWITGVVLLSAAAVPAIIWVSLALHRIYTVSRWKKLTPDVTEIFKNLIEFLNTLLKERETYINQQLQAKIKEPVTGKIPLNKEEEARKYDEEFPDKEKAFKLAIHLAAINTPHEEFNDTCKRIAQEISS